MGEQGEGGHHSSKWYFRHPEVQRPETTQSPKPKTQRRKADKPTSKFLYYLRTAGFVSLLVAIGAMLMEDYFWWFVIFLYLGLAAAIVDAIKEHQLGWSRYIPVLLFATIAALFTFKVVIGSVYPEFTAQWTKGNYAKGSDIHGLSWEDGWSYMAFSIYNKPGADLRGLNVTFTSDQSIAAVKMASDVPCSVFQSGITAELTVRSSNGEQRLMHPIGGNTPYRLLCDTVPADTSIRLAVAIANTQPLNELLRDRAIPSDLLGPKIKPNWVVVRARYRAGLRPYDVTEKLQPTEY